MTVIVDVVEKESWINEFKVILKTMVEVFKPEKIADIRNLTEEMTSQKNFWIQVVLLVNSSKFSRSQGQLDQAIIF